MPRIPDRLFGRPVTKGQGRRCADFGDAGGDWRGYGCGRERRSHPQRTPSRDRMDDRSDRAWKAMRVMTHISVVTPLLRQKRPHWKVHSSAGALLLLQQGCRRFRESLEGIFLRNAIEGAF